MNLLLNFANMYLNCLVDVERCSGHVADYQYACTKVENKLSKRSWNERRNVVFIECYQKNQFRKSLNKGQRLARPTRVIISMFICCLSTEVYLLSFPPVFLSILSSKRREYQAEE
jgi:hypothetical protein